MRDEVERTKGEYQIRTGTAVIDRNDFYQYRDALVKELIAVAENPEWNPVLQGFYLGKYENRYGAVVYIRGDVPAPLKDSIVSEFEEAS